MSHHLASLPTSEPANPAPTASSLVPISNVLSAHQRALFAQRLAVLIRRLRAAANTVVEGMPNEH